MNSETYKIAICDDSQADSSDTFLRGGESPAE